MSNGTIRVFDSIVGSELKTTIDFGGAEFDVSATRYACNELFKCDVVIKNAVFSGDNNGTSKQDSKY